MSEFVGITREVYNELSENYGNYQAISKKFWEISEKLREF